MTRAGTSQVLALLVLRALAGCTDGNEIPPDPTQTAPDAQADAGEVAPDASDDAQAPSPLGPVWLSTSVRLELSAFNFFEGSMAYDITRELLTEQQLALLAALREIPTPSGPLGADFASYTIRITDSSGDVERYRAAQDNVIDSDEVRVSGVRSIDYASLVPFLATFRCLSAKALGPSDPSEPAVSPWAQAATFNSDPGCLNGLFFSNGDSHAYRKWQVAVAGTYRLRLSKCFQQSSLRLLDPTGQTELAASAAANAPDCPSLTYTFSEPGVYKVDVQKRRDPALDHDSAGDMMFRVSRQ